MIARLTCHILGHDWSQETSYWYADAYPERQCWRCKKVEGMEAASLDELFERNDCD
jgi:hypothetical protein